MHKMGLACVINKMKVVLKVEKCSLYGTTAIHLYFPDARTDKLYFEWLKLTQILVGV